MMVITAGVMKAQAVMVQKASATSGASTFVTVVLGSGTTVSHYLIAVVMFNAAGSASNSITTVTDSNSNTWTQAVISNDRNFPVAAIYYAPISTSCATANCETITISFTATVDRNMTVAEYSGLTTFGALDQINHTENAGSTSLTSGNVTTTQALELMIGVAVPYSTTSPLPTAGAGWTSQAAAAVGTAECYIFEDQNVSSTGTYAATATSGFSPTATATAIATFKAAAAPSGGTIVRSVVQ